MEPSPLQWRGVWGQNASIGVTCVPLFTLLVPLALPLVRLGPLVPLALPLERLALLLAPLEHLLGPLEHLLGPLEHLLGPLEHLLGPLEHLLVLRVPLPLHWRGVWGRLHSRERQCDHEVSSSPPTYTLEWCHN